MVVAGLAGYGVLKLRRAPDGITRPGAADAAAPRSGPRQLAAKARAHVDRLDSTREDYALATDLLKQAMDADSIDAEVWAACAQLHERYLIRGFDVTAQRRELARTSVQRARCGSIRSLSAAWPRLACSSRSAATRRTCARVNGSSGCSTGSARATSGRCARWRPPSINSDGYEAVRP